VLRFFDGRRTREALARDRRHLAIERRALRRLIDFEVLVDADARPCAD